ncbi:phycocyanin operon protein Y [Synechococcales cyanobacterium C]|uniref:Phycocyanin operon protein Y n=1 Tax=Petrachloros mirabilis ULC683 TaxID=2781853 RepID=A0A8K1ZYA8_9CYAN|nr:HEAT repeat domain-containing protein [Petrachloros mirabilis]NCJ06077.1 phycocyanin operon protein Y [Petrachloros mirabilis ULC683]
MDKRFFNFFNLSETEAIDLLDTPQSQIGPEDSRYIAAAHLVNFPTALAIQALIRAVDNTDPGLDNRIVRRKSIETLGRLRATQALPTIHACLADPDPYTVENAVWALGEIGSRDPALLEDVAQLLERPKQLYRAIIHTLSKLGYQPALARIQRFTEAEDSPVRSAAITAVCRLTQDYTAMVKVVGLLQHREVFTRRLCIQDLMDAQYYPALNPIARCPVSLVFRLRAIRHLSDQGLAAGALTFAEIQPALEQTLRDHPQDLDLVHRYDTLPSLGVLIQTLYETDFGRCYLAAHTILAHYSEAAPEALFATYEEEAYCDYGAHFHVVKLMGWLKHAPAYDLLIEALHHPQPQFQKSRAAAAIALGELGDQRAIPHLLPCLEAGNWELRYAAIMALEQLGDRSGVQLLHDPDWLIQAKARDLAQHS